MTKKTDEFFPKGKRGTVLLLRWLMIIALSYLMLFHESQIKLSWQVIYLILLFGVSNLILTVVPPRLFERAWFNMGMVVGDTMIISGAMVISEFSSANLLFFYFLIILVTTLGKGSQAVMTNGLVIIGTYLMFLFLTEGRSVLQNTNQLLQIPFLIICALFYGFIVDQEHRKQRYVLDQIRTVSELMASSLSLRAIYQTTLDAMVNILGADTCSIMLLEPDGKSLTVQDARGLDPKLIGTSRQPVGEGIAGRIVQEGRPLLMNDFPLITPKRSDYANKGIISSISVPLRFKGRTIGVLNMASFSQKPRFQKQDLDLLSHFAAEIATTIENARLFEELRVKTQEIKSAHFEVIQALAEALESKDVYTGGHARRLAIYTDAIARKAGLSHEEIELLRYASILHDVGKIGVPDAILHNTGSLTPEQWVLVKAHAEKGAMMVSQIHSLSHVSRYIRHHHERWDGKGYPDGLKGESIPLYSRMISIADTYDALTTQRTYQDAVKLTEAIAVLKRCAGIQLDPVLVQYFIASLESSEILQTLCLDSSGNPITHL